MHQMTPHLKQLRLSGILETLEARNRQAIEAKWSYVDFLARLLEDEVERRTQKQLALRLRRATLNTIKTLWKLCIDTRNKFFSDSGETMHHFEHTRSFRSSRCQ